MKKFKDLLKKGKKWPSDSHTALTEGGNQRDIPGPSTVSTNGGLADPYRGQFLHQLEQNIQPVTPVHAENPGSNANEGRPSFPHEQNVSTAAAPYEDIRVSTPERSQENSSIERNLNAQSYANDQKRNRAHNSDHNLASHYTKQNTIIQRRPVDRGKIGAQSTRAAHDEQLNLCEACKKLNLHAVFSEQGYLHHPGPEAVLRSAELGCASCTVFVKILSLPRKDPMLDPTRSIIIRAQDWKQPKSTHNLEFLVDGEKAWGTARLYTHEDHPSAAWIPGRPYHRHAGDDSLINQIAAWLHVCDSLHPECKIPHSTIQPDYFVYIGDVQSERIRLRKAGRNTRYVALSHCWGKEPLLTTVAESLAEYMQQIPYHQLPKTFVDAIFLARKLGVEYIWIDSLCIVQNSREHWAQESAKMGSVYANAYVTLAASTSPDGRTGFLVPRQGPFTSPEIQVTNKQTSCSGTSTLSPQPYSFQLVPKDYDDKWARYWHNEDHSISPSMPLNDRAWTLQERVLSTRVVAFEESAGVHMRCRRRMIFERGLSIPPVPWTASDKESEARERIATGVWPPPSTELQSRDAQLSVWYSLLQQYSSRRLTQQRDKLPALSGLATAFHEVFGGQYLAGMWEDDFLYGLLWKANHFYLEKSQTFDDAPSWSWASVEVGVFALTKDFPRAKHPFASPDAFAVQLLDTFVEPKTSNPFGQVSRATITLLGVLRVVDVVVTDRGQYGLDCEIREPGTRAPTLGTAFMDYEPASNRFEVTCVRMTRDWPCVVLLLMPAKGPNTYRRVGIAYVRGVGIGDALEQWWCVGKTEVITIV